MKSDWGTHSPTLELQQLLWKTPHTEIHKLYKALRDPKQPLCSEQVLAEIDLFYLLVYVMNRKDADQPFVYERAREVEQEPDDCIDIWSRGHYKTSVSNALIIQDILKDPNICIGVFSNVQDIAIASIREVKNNLEKNERLKALYPNILYKNPTALKGIQWNSTALTVKRTTHRKEPTVECSGLIEGTPIGRHYDLLIYDDIVVPKSVATADQIKKTTDAFYLSLSMSTKSSRRRIYGTRYHHKDTYSELIERGSYKLRLIPATSDGTISGDPVFFSQEEWERLCAETQAKDIACQYLLDPSQSFEKVFDIKDLVEWEVRPQHLDVYILADPARSKHHSACDTAIVVVGVTPKNGHLYLLDGHCHRMSLSERWESLIKTITRWKTHETGVNRVTIAYESIGNDDIEYFQEQMKRTDNFHHIIPMTRTHNGPAQKASRIERIGPDLKSHRIHVPYDNSAHPNKLTRAQAVAFTSGQKWLLPKPIRQRRPDNSIYDLTTIFREQLRDYPATKVDLLDAFSRIYDQDIRRSSTGAGDRFGRTYVMPRGRFGVPKPQASLTPRPQFNPVVNGRSGRFNWTEGARDSAPKTRFK